MEGLFLRISSVSLLYLCLSVVLAIGDRSGLLLVPKSEVDGATQESMAYGVLKRLLPRHVSCFDLHIVPEYVECKDSNHHDCGSPTLEINQVLLMIMVRSLEAKRIHV